MQRCLEEIIEIRYEFEYRFTHPDKRDVKNDVTEEVKREFGYRMHVETTFSSRRAMTTTPATVPIPVAPHTCPL